MTDKKTIIPGLAKADFGVVTPARQVMVAEITDTDGSRVHFNLTSGSIGRFVTDVLMAASQIEAEGRTGDSLLNASQLIPASSCGLVASDQTIGLTVRVGPVDLIFPMSKAALTKLAKEILDESGMVAIEPKSPIWN